MKSIEMYKHRIRMNFNGSICVASAHDADSEIDNILALCVMEETFKPETPLPQHSGKSTSEFEYSIELCFSNAKSVQAVMNVLKKVRKSITKGVHNEKSKTKDFKDKKGRKVHET